MSSLTGELGLPSREEGERVPEREEWSVGLGSGITGSLFGDLETLVKVFFFSVALVHGTLDISEFRTAHGTGAKRFQLLRILLGGDALFSQTR